MGFTSFCESRNQNSVNSLFLSCHNSPWLMSQALVDVTIPISHAQLAILWHRRSSAAVWTETDQSRYPRKTASPPTYHASSCCLCMLLSWLVWIQLYQKLGDFVVSVGTPQLRGHLNVYNFSYIGMFVIWILIELGSILNEMIQDWFYIVL